MYTFIISLANGSWRTASLVLFNYHIVASNVDNSACVSQADIKLSGPAS